MKSKIALGLLLVACFVLAGVMVVTRQKTVRKEREHQSLIVQFSNDWTKASSKVLELSDVNTGLNEEVKTKQGRIEELNTKLTDEQAARAKVEADAQKAAQIAQEEMAKRDAQIADYQAKMDTQTKQMVELNSEIQKLEQKITNTEKELAATKGDKEFLLTELKRLQSEKSRLEAQFNDLAVLREQVRKLKDELAMAKRLEWIQSGVYTTHSSARGGATKLMQGFSSPSIKTNNADLNVELDLEGKVKVNPTPPPATK